MLQLLLMHTGGGLSLKQAAMRAAELGLTQVGAAALFKRLRAAEPWLRHLTAQMLEEMSTKLTQLGDSGRRWRIFDATDIVETGPTGVSWRVHCSLCLPELACDLFEVTDAHGGESFKRLPVKSAEVVLAGRGYADRQGAARILAAGADVVVRINAQTFSLLKGDGGGFGVPSCLRRLHGQACGEWRVGFAWKGRLHPARLCAVRKSAINAERSRRKAKRKSSNNGHHPVRPETLGLAGYILVLTTLPPADFPAKTVLGIYRRGWQVELAFKRLKSLLAFGHVPKTAPDSCRGWLQGKILAALLIKRILRHGRFFPHGVMNSDDPGAWRCFMEVRDSLLAALRRPLSLRHLPRHVRGAHNPVLDVLSMAALCASTHNPVPRRFHQRLKDKGRHMASSASSRLCARSAARSTKAASP